jgi:hypothetical protein
MWSGPIWARPRAVPGHPHDPQVSLQRHQSDDAMPGDP